MDKETKPVRVSFEWVLDTVRISGVKVIQKRVSSGDIEVSVSVCRESESGESKKANMGGQGTSFVVRIEV